MTLCMHVLSHVRPDERLPCLERMAVDQDFFTVRRNVGGDP